MDTVLPQKEENEEEDTESKLRISTAVSLE